MKTNELADKLKRWSVLDPQYCRFWLNDGGYPQCCVYVSENRKDVYVSQEVYHESDSDVQIAIQNSCSDKNVFWTVSGQNSAEVKCIAHVGMMVCYEELPGLALLNAIVKYLEGKNEK